MKKYSKVLASALFACMLALFAGCSSSGASASVQSSDAGSATAEASAESSQAASDVAADGAASASAQAASTIDAANLADGEYQIEVTLEGGSGKATIESPARLTVEGGAITMVVVWSSPNYDQMVVNGEQYFPVPRAGNSTFQIPVATLAEPLAVQAETTAMSQPHMIDYVIHFDVSTLQ